MKCPTRQKNNYIEKYILDELSKSQKKRFEKHLFQCPECAHEAGIIQELALSLKLAGQVGLIKERAIPTWEIANAQSEIKSLQSSLVNKVINLLNSSFVSFINNIRNNLESGLHTTIIIFTNDTTIEYHISSCNRLDNQTLAVILTELFHSDEPMEFIFS